ncbi:MAG: preprotein translocase subunit YajC [Clostridia bacterium]|nr:preprotein translocase subunit YajC [Clostridia bacterium]
MMNFIGELISDLGIVVAYAEGEAAQGAAAGAGAAPAMSGGLINILLLVFVIAMMYFMLIRPQKKREKETKAMLDALKVGDKIVTIGGICGKVSKIKDDFVIIETGNIGTPDEKSFLKMERDSIKTVETKKTN